MLSGFKPDTHPLTPATLGDWGQAADYAHNVVMWVKMIMVNKN